MERRCTPAAPRKSRQGCVRKPSRDPLQPASGAFPVHAELGHLANGHAAEPFGFADCMESGEAAEQQPEGDLSVEPRERRTEAEVNAGGERYVRVR